MKFIASIQMGDKTCIRDLASKLNLAPSTVWKMIKRGELNPHTNAMHPEILEDNKLVRIHWIISLLVQDSIPIQPKYKCLYDFVHIDEKWFYLSRKS